ncbi:hypothetical protein B566_EDAN010331 [Ephemera danica]|nr:hypothetical protein B566_EDAN010331 [Ephemera danica]
MFYKRISTGNHTSSDEYESDSCSYSSLHADRRGRRYEAVMSESVTELAETSPRSSSPRRKYTFDLDTILIEIGEFGRFQAFTYILICLPVFFSAANSLTYVFTAGIPPYRCLVPGCDNETNPQYAESWLQYAIPDASESSEYEPEHCKKYIRNESSPLNTCNSEDFLRENKEGCYEWVFHPGEYTIVNEWNITCLENQWKLSLVGTLHFAGILVGSFVFGYMADRYGRKMVLVFSLVCMSVTGITQAIAPSYVVFQIFVFLNAIATAGVYPLAFILGVEMVGPSKREMSSIVINYFYAVGEASVGVVAWLSGNWKVLQLAVSAPPFFFIIYYWLVPESVRWLLTQREHMKASKILIKAAHTNKVILSEGLLSSLREDASRAANAFVYYGLSVNSTSLGGNKYINFTAVCLAEIPGYTMAWLLLKRGRRPSLCGSLMLCAVTCLGAAFVPTDNEWAILILFLVGKVGITSSFAIIYVYTAELYPTPMRSASVGACSMMARIGAMVAPFVPLLVSIQNCRPVY